MPFEDLPYDVLELIVKARLGRRSHTKKLRKLSLINKNFVAICQSILFTKLSIQQDPLPRPPQDRSNDTSSDASIREWLGLGLSSKWTPPSYDSFGLFLAAAHLELLGHSRHLLTHIQTLNLSLNDAARCDTDWQFVEIFDACPNVNSVTLQWYIGGPPVEGIPAFRTAFRGRKLVEVWLRPATLGTLSILDEIDGELEHLGIRMPMRDDVSLEEIAASPTRIFRPEKVSFIFPYGNAAQEGIQILPFITAPPVLDLGSSLVPSVLTAEVGKWTAGYTETLRFDMPGIGKLGYSKRQATSGLGSYLTSVREVHLIDNRRPITSLPPNIQQLRIDVWPDNPFDQPFMRTLHAYIKNLPPGRCIHIFLALSILETADDGTYLPWMLAWNGADGILLAMEIDALAVAGSRCKLNQPMVPFMQKVSDKIDLMRARRSEAKPAKNS